MNWLLRADRATGKLNRAIGDHLVRVHVGLRARTGLKHDQRKLTVQTAVDYFLCGTHDQINFLLRKLAQISVGEGGTLLQDAECSDHRSAPPETLDPNWKVGVRPLGLRAPQMLGRHLDFP